jgi:hypothetical protein
MSRLFLFLLCAMTLSSCAGTVYDRPGGTKDQLEVDYADCRSKAAFLPQQPSNPNEGGLASVGDGLGHLATYEQFMQDCLRARGWKRVS